jgi:hypothetical protein
LTLTVANGQTLPNNADTEIKFDLVNPKYSQDGPAVVEISAHGDVPISAERMVLGGGNLAPLKVVASQFTIATIEDSTKAPGAVNTITVTLQPSALLSRSRNSIITIDGLSGSMTDDTLHLPIVMGTGLDKTTFVSPAGSYALGFSPQCKLSDDKVVLVTKNEGDDPTGAVLMFDAGGCQTGGRWTKIVSYDHASNCATLETAGDPAAWTDETAKCEQMGVIEHVRVVSGGEAYEAGAFSVESQDGGTGLTGTCTVDELGTVQSVTVTDPGMGYGTNTIISCPRACTSQDVCDAAAEAELAFEIVHDSGVLSAAAEWHRSTGTLKLAVRSELSTAAPTVFSFNIKNSMATQEKQPVFIMASGAKPIGAAELNGEVLAISGTSVSVTKVCTTAAADTPCAVSFDELPTADGTGRLYTLSAEIQCNGGAEGVVITTGSSTEQAVTQPPSTCTDSCNEYHRLFSNVDVSNDVGSNALDVSAGATAIGTDYCGAGDDLKVIFILSY